MYDDQEQYQALQEEAEQADREFEAWDYEQRHDEE